MKATSKLLVITCKVLDTLGLGHLIPFVIFLQVSLNRSPVTTDLIFGRVEPVGEDMLDYFLQFWSALSDVVLNSTFSLSCVVFLWMSLKN